MKKIFVFLMVLLLGACVVKPEKVVDMGVDFGNDNAKYLTFPLSYDSNTISLSFWAVYSGAGDDGNTWSDSRFLFGRISSTHSFYFAGYATHNLVTHNAYALTPGTLYHVVVTHDNTNPANDPIVYVNGATVAQTFKDAGTGTPVTNNGGSVKIGQRESGILYDVKLYPRILTAAEVLDLYNSRCKMVNDNGLVFHADLNGAAGALPFDGATLGASNTLVDRIGGAVGTPSGNPVGYGDTVLSCSGE